MSSNFALELTRRRLLTTIGAAGAAGVLGIESAHATSGPTNYSATWASVDQHPPAPEWFQDAKFGIYFHWGVFSVPAYGDEWYPRRMYISGDACNTHHVATYGDPSVWPYNNFIDGGYDKSGNFVQFAPKLTSAGGAFDPNAWAQLFKNAGAMFAGTVAEHHDGYSMWNSQVNEWNSVGRGPHLDLVGLHAQAIRAQGLKFITTFHTAYHFNGYYDHVPAQSAAAAEALRAARHGRGEPALVQQARRGHQRLPARPHLPRLRSEPGRGDLPAPVPRLLLQPGGRVEQGRPDHLQGRVRQSRRGLRLRARRPWQPPDALLGDRRQHLGLHLVLRHRNRLLHDPAAAALDDRPDQQGRHHAAQHRADGERDHPVRAAVRPAGDRRLPRPLRRIHLRHQGLERLRRRPHADGRRRVHRRRRRHSEGHPLHPQQGQYGAVRHRIGLAG